MAKTSLNVPGIGPYEVNTETLIGAELAAHCADLGDAQKFLMGQAEPWPEDAYGNVFVGNALQRLGRFMFPNKWTGYELAARSLIGFSPSGENVRPLMPLSLEGIAAIADLAGEPFHDERINAGLKDLIKEANLRDPITMQFVSNVRKAREAAREIIDPAVRRAEAAREAMRIALRDGQLTAIPLPREGGAFGATIEREAWNALHLARYRLVMCTINPNRDELFRNSKPTHWVFVPEAQFSKLLSMVRVTADGSFADHQVPDIRIAYDAANRSEKRWPTSVDLGTTSPVKRAILLALAEHFTPADIEAMPNLSRRNDSVWAKVPETYPKSPMPHEKTFRRLFAEVQEWWDTSAP